MAKATRFGAMTLSITAGVLAPLLAQDQKITLPKDLFRPLTPKNFGDLREKLLSGVRAAVDGKLRQGIALDASMKDLADAVDAFKEATASDEPAEEANKAIEEFADIEAPKSVTEPGATYDAEPLKAYMKQCGMDDDMIAKAMDMMPKNGLAGDEKDDEDELEKAQEKNDDMGKDMVSKPAMDAALKAQASEFEKQIKSVRDAERAVRAAIAEVQPWVGELPATMAFDSAADVYRHALVMRGVEGAKALHPDALKPILSTLPKSGAKQSTEHAPALAMDSVQKAIKLAPGLENISTTL